ncbi:MAG: hypothetical protein JW944_02530 [Deltaproteobacteria bacterium]|nr:hypothetical protein [Deltaproteobacteria bacterium]
MDMNRKLVKKISVDEDTDDGYVKAEKSELFSIIWEITKDNWAFLRVQDVERRLQRYVATIIRRTS